jgi:hypothetical protein
MNLPTEKEVFTKNFKYYPYIPLTSVEKKQKEYFEKNVDKIKNLFPTPLGSSPSSASSILGSPSTPNIAAFSPITSSAPLSSNTSPQKIVCETPESAYQAILFEQPTNDYANQLEELKEEIQAQEAQIAENQIILNLQKTTLETNTQTIKEKQDRIQENEKQIKKQEFAINYNSTISEQLIQNINSLNTEVVNKTSILNIVNKQVAEAQQYLQDLQNKINSSQALLQNLEASVYNCQQELTYHRNMLGQIHMMSQNPEYAYQMANTMAGYLAPRPMYEVNEFN